MLLSDRYILREFLQAFGYCLAAFVLMRVVYELFQTLREFLEWRSSILAMAEYYLLVIPGAVAVTLPAAIFFGLLFTLVTMSKNNELIALRAAGLSLPRSCAPIVGVALVVTALLFWLNETVAPAANGEAARLHDFEKHKRKEQKYIVEAGELMFVRGNLTYVNDREKRTWFFGRFNTKTLSGENVIVDCRPRGLPEQSVNAQFAYWVGGHWLFQNVRVITYTPGGEPASQISHDLWEPTTINDLPEDIMLYCKENPEFMTLGQLRRYLELHPGEKLAKFRVNYQQRYAFPWACLLACLMAIPLGGGTGRRSALAGVAVALVLFVLYFVLYYAGLTLGKQGALDPTVAVWMANAVFMLLSLIMMWRVR